MTTTPQRLELLHHLVERAHQVDPEANALESRHMRWTYDELSTEMNNFASSISTLCRPGERMAIWLSKTSEFVVAAFGASKAGVVFVPVNPVLKAAQVGHILRDCDVSVLITSPERLSKLRAEGDFSETSLRHVIVTGTAPLAVSEPSVRPIIKSWNSLGPAADFQEPARRGDDVAAIFYTSGSTGLPKGVVIPHRSLITGAASVAEYLGQVPQDRVLAAMPLSFDAGFSQLTTTFYAGACCYLLDYFLPTEVVKTIQQKGITGLTGVPPFWNQLANINWPEAARHSLRYFATTGGRMPQETLRKVRDLAVDAKPYLMYGLTEAFRSTYLDPEEVDVRVNSIGRAIPGQNVYVARPDGSPCDPGETGELVHVGSTVCLGYWNRPEATAKRFKLIDHPAEGVLLPQMAVFSGDLAKTDADGFIYFVGRTDNMIKCSGYRISPVEVEEAIYESGSVDDVIAYGVDDPDVGQRVAIIAYSSRNDLDAEAVVKAACVKSLPVYMVPRIIHIHSKPLPRNPNGKLDRAAVLSMVAKLGSSSESLAA